MLEGSGDNFVSTFVALSCRADSLISSARNNLVDFEFLREKGEISALMEERYFVISMSAGLLTYGWVQASIEGKSKREDPMIGSGRAENAVVYHIPT